MKYYYVVHLASRHYPLSYSFPDSFVQVAGFRSVRDSPFLPKQLPLHFLCTRSGGDSHSNEIRQPQILARLSVIILFYQVPGQSLSGNNQEREIE